MERKPVVIAQEALEKEAAVCEQIKALWASRGRTPRAFVDTYGCQQNEADSERIRGMLRASGYEIVSTRKPASTATSARWYTPRPDTRSRKFFSAAA